MGLKPRSPTPETSALLIQPPCPVGRRVKRLGREGVQRGGKGERRKIGREGLERLARRVGEAEIGEERRDWKGRSIGRTIGEIGRVTVGSRPLSDHCHIKRFPPIFAVSTKSGATISKGKPAAPSSGGAEN